MRAADPRGLDIGELVARAVDYGRMLAEVKAELHPEGFWYPYGTLGNLWQIERLLTGPNRSVLALAGDGPIADVGTGDGDLGFFFESLGCDVDLIDNGPTNFNGLRGARSLREALASRATIWEVDLDSRFALPREHYGLVFFLGTLYHLQNPYYALRALARCTRHCLLSTRVAQVTVDRQVRLADAPVAYLVAPTETNNDPTNYWIFSPAGLRRILDRTGWTILDYMTVGATTDSDPASPDRDERAFCLLRSASVSHPLAR
jgi:tRNA (mo5U34)-methyltransferase